MGRDFLVRYKYIDTSFRERFGCAPISFTTEEVNEEGFHINEAIYNQVRLHLYNIGILSDEYNEKHVYSRPCWSIDELWEDQHAS